LAVEGMQCGSWAARIEETPFEQEDVGAAIAVAGDSATPVG
jgi:hypothetical protein